MPIYDSPSEEIVATREEIESIASVHASLQDSFMERCSRSFESRMKNLRALERLINENYEAISLALMADLHQSDPTPHLLEVIRETDYMIRNLSSLMKSKSASSEISIVNFPSTAELVPEPLGVVLILGTWNYPFHSSLGPLAGAIAAGNTVLVKPGSLARASSRLMADLIKMYFDPSVVRCVEGGKEVIQPLLALKWDHIMFTGSPQMGRVVMAAASQHLTSVTLELGGKNPVIVTETADIALAARRICWSKFASNAGQVCISCDHLFVHHQVADAFITAMKDCIREFFPQGVDKDENYCRIISQGHTQRLQAILNKDQDVVVFGGAFSVQNKYVSPTILDFETDWNAFKSSACMEGEIFGPILPILRYTDVGEVEAFLKIQTRSQPPLAFYVFSGESRHAIRNRWIASCPAGAIVVNDCGMHIAEDCLPFGGIGNSGIGSYHGKRSFAIFTHYKPVLYKTRWLDIPMRYPPLTLIKQRVVRFLLWLSRNRVTPIKVGKSILVIALLWRILT